MKLLQKKTLSVLLLGALIPVLSGCGSNSSNANTNANANAAPEKSNAAATATEAPKETEVKSEPVTISYIGAASQLAVGNIKELIAQWEQKTGNKVDIQAIQDDQYDNLVKAKLSGGGDVDVFFGAYSKYDVPNQLLEISGESFESRLNDVALSSLKYTDGKIYAFPYPSSQGTWGVFYNKTIFSDLGLTVPKTMDDLNKDLAAIKAGGKTPFYFAAKDGWTMLQHHNAVNGILGGADAQVWDKLNKNEVQWKDIPDFVHQYKQVEDWAKKGYFNKDFLTGTYEKQQLSLAKGDVAMVVQGAFFVPEVIKQNADAQIGFFPLPNQDGSETIGLSGGTQIFIAKSSKHPEESKDLLRFLTEQPQAQSALEAAPGISPFKDVDVSAKMPDAVKEVQAFVNTGKIAKHGDDAYVIPMPYDDLVAAYAELLAGKITADQFVQKHQDMYAKNAKIAKIPGF
ncbi:extracellular solute-binding protein [Paenibacillus sp.]|uniref:ABC transporter substrate-binding protein n=1 Tax=Paenibacillus sp. TaxID=58172 RepID=UPI0028AE5C2B|nr:extracellular solute-binding protein [Paenibacillus sp.]